jgi:hypothetical protein
MVGKKGKEERGGNRASTHLVLALARLEVQIRDIHLLETERTFLRFLHRTKDTDMRLIKGGHVFRPNLFVAPVRVLNACEDGRLCLKCRARMNYGCRKRWKEFERGHAERGQGDGRDCKSKRDRKARRRDNEGVAVPFSHALISVPRSPLSQPNHG